MVPNKRLQVFSMREVGEKEQRRTMWVKAGSAWFNRDGSMNVYLDVLPLDGKLHVREAIVEARTGDTSSTQSPQQHQQQQQQQHQQTATTNGSSSQQHQAWLAEAAALGGH